MMSHAKPLKIKSLIPINFAITKTCIAVRLTGDGTRMGGISFQLYPSIKWEQEAYSFEWTKPERTWQIHKQ